MAAVQQEQEDGRVRRSVKQYLPILGWLPSYRRNWFIVDTVAAAGVRDCNHPARDPRQRVGFAE